MASREITQELIDAFIGLARGDFSVRVARNFKRDTDDVLAFFVNLIAEQLDRLMAEREQSHKRLEAGVTELSESFLGLAAGDFSVRAQRNHKGDPLDVLAFLFNNTAAEVGQAFAQLEQQRHGLETILESMIDGVLLLDARGVVRRANAAMAQVLGYGNTPLTGMPLRALLAEREGMFAETLAESVRAAAFRDRSVWFRTKDGGVLPLTVNGSPERSPDGVLLGIVLVTRDDRELKRAQAQLQMSDRLTTMGTLAAGVAHEINNPLAFMIANLDFVSEELELAHGSLDESTHAEVMRALKASLGGADRVRQIVGDLKSFSRSDQETIGAVDVRKLVDSAANMLRNELRHHARLEKQFDDVPFAIGNEARLLQVFLNLLQNAAQSIPVGSVETNLITAKTGLTAEGEVFVEIRDTGCGIPEEHRARMFDAFFTTKPVGVGTGLGLSICHKIVTSLEGRIEVASEVGVGSTFRVVLRAASDELIRSSSPLLFSSRPPARTRVLVIDDEIEVGLSVERVLAREHEVVCTTRAATALELLRKEDFDLILCDLMMPEMTGMELYAQFVQESSDLAQRIVFMTGGAFGTGSEQFLERVPNQRIEKPFDMLTLRELAANPPRAHWKGEGQR